MAMNINEVFELNAKPTLDTAQVFYGGVECEIESVNSRENIGVWTITSDQSLRNEGYEFLSPPLPEKELMEAFTYLHAKIKHGNPDQAFSERTSTHVHVNCRSLTQRQVSNMMHIYALFEELFFFMVEPHRRDNIHCVPLTETHLPSLYKTNVRSLVLNNAWSKYTAFNLLPLRELGTVEFRHMHGTRDAALMKDWIQVLSNLWTVCQKTQMSSAFLAKQENIDQLFASIFGHVPKVMATAPLLSRTISNSLLDVKLSLI